VAGHIASALKARKLILLTDTQGVLDKQSKLISSIKVKDCPELIQDGTIKGGMIPKVNCCADALRGGVKKAHIIDGRKDHAILLEIFTKGGVGTEIVPYIKLEARNSKSETISNDQNPNDTNLNERQMTALPVWSFENSNF
jgi:acetylglutamate kinase